MSDENYGFCPNCGHKLEEDSAYCPDCGAVLKPTAPGSGVSGTAYPRLKGKNKPMESQFLMCFILLAAYSAIMLIAALTGLFAADYTVDSMKVLLEGSGMTFEEFLSSMGLVMTEAEFVTYLQLTGAISLVCTIPALISTVLCFMRRKHMIAVATAGLATLAAFAMALMSGSILNVVFETMVGAVVTYLLYKNCADYFED